MSLDQNAVSNHDDQTDAPVGKLRLFPTVSFGVRATALSGIALPIGILAVSALTGEAPVADGGAWAMYTTCCPPAAG